MFASNSCPLSLSGFFFFQNNTKTQTISLVSTFSKLFSKITSRVYGTRFCCAKLSIKNLSSMELELQRLDFQETQIETQRRRTNKRRRRNPYQKIRRRNPNRNTKKQQTIKKEQTGEIKPKQKPRRRRSRTQISLTQTVGSDDVGSRGGGGEAQSEGLPTSFIFLSGSLGLMMFRCFSCLSLCFDDVFLSGFVRNQVLKTRVPWKTSLLHSI